MKKYTKEEIIERFKQVHGTCYDYSKVDYKTFHEAVEIVCPKHGSFFQRPSVHLRGALCPLCSAEKRGFNKRLTTEEYIQKAKQVHGDKYDYSKVQYTTAKCKICIICPIHGEFWQLPQEHLKSCDCPICAKSKHKKLIYGVAINDLDEKVYKTKFYNHWKAMLDRCFNENIHKKHPTYKGCKVCDEWLVLSNFKKWFDENYIEDWQLDKDILVKKNKLYSPQTCCFVPREVNTLFTKSNSSRGECFIGVSYDKIKNKYEAHVNMFGKTKYFRGFDNEYDAFVKYKIEKEKEIKRITEKYKSKLHTDVYDALVNYNVEIND